MFSKSFVAIAMLSVFFTATAFGQGSQAKGTPKSERKARINSSHSTAFTGSDEEIGALVAWRSANRNSVRKPKTSNLIDTSTGEIVWADEVKANQPNASKIQRNRQQPFDKGYLSPYAKAPKRLR